VSGIAGIFYLDGRQVAHQPLQKMSNRLAGRGVGGSRIWSDGLVGLVQSMFATTSESDASYPPLVYETGRLAITADARIDNRRELAASLGLQGDEAERPDEYFILKAYEKWGQDCAGKLLGDFAFALWDRDRHQLFCARDSMGVKPFYYYNGPYGFIFASEIKAILALDEVPRQLNELCLLDYLVDDRQDNQVTFFQGISRLPPACFLSVSPENFQMSLYWSLASVKEVRFNHSEEYAEKFLELFTQAVKARLRSTLPVGCALSGGLDSSSVASVARNILSASEAGPLNTYSAIFSGLPDHELNLVDERIFIEKVLSTGKFQPHYVDMGLLGPLAGMGEVLRVLDEPVSAPTLPMFRELYKAASHQGIGVYLEGIDGDQVVSHGYERFPDLVRHLKWSTWIREVRNMSGKSGISQGEIIKRFTLQLLIPPSIYQLLRKSRRRRGISKDISGYLSTDFIHKKVIKSRLDELHRRQNSLPHSAKEAHLRELTSGSVQLSLESLDKIAARCNIQVRYPFYDKRVVEYCFALPVDQKLSGGWSRFIFRDSLAGIVPEEIRWRYSKANFNPFFTGGMWRFSRPLLKELMSGKSADLVPYLDTARLHALYQRYISGGLCSTGEVEIIYRSILLSKWIEFSKSIFQSGNF
jgi:asparagine synthase (glutamine-hydrolysing)